MKRADFTIAIVCAGLLSHSRLHRQLTPTRYYSPFTDTPDALSP